MASEKEYDEMVIKIHKLYEEMFSVNERDSTNLGQTWRIHLTFGGLLVHSGTLIETIRRNSHTWGDLGKKFDEIHLDKVDALNLVKIYLYKKFFGKNPEGFAEICVAFFRKYREVHENIYMYINASNRGREIPFEDLQRYYLMLQAIKKTNAFKMFFLHKTFIEYLRDAINYFEKNKINLRDAVLEVYKLKI